MLLRIVMTVRPGRVLAVMEVLQVLFADANVLEHRVCLAAAPAFELVRPNVSLLIRELAEIG